MAKMVEAAKALLKQKFVKVGFKFKVNRVLWSAAKIS